MKEYLDTLYKKLYFLNKEERINIIGKYKQIINDKLDNGEDIDTILNKLGSTDTLVKNICEEHNLDYNYLSNQTKFSKDITNISNIISDFIKSIIKVIRKSYLSNSIESFIQCIVRIIIFVLVAFIIKLPFIVIEDVVLYINKIIFYPINTSFDYIYKIVSSIIYFMICITCLIKIFGEHKIHDKQVVDKKKIDSVDKEYSWLNFTIKILIYLVILVPLCILMSFDILLIFISIYMVIKGVSLIGLIILFTGLFGLLFVIFTMVKNSLYNKNKNYLLSIIIFIVLFIFGILLTIVNINSFSKPNNLDKSSIQSTTEKLNIELKTSNIDLIVKNGNYEIIEDNSLSDLDMILEITYYDDYVDVLVSQEIVNDNNYLIVKSVKDDKINYNKFINNIYKDLKNGYIFNYSNTNKIYVKIYCNNSIKSIIENNA